MHVFPRSRPDLGARDSGRNRCLGIGIALLSGLVAFLLPVQSAFAEGSADLNIGPGTALRNRLVVDGGNNGPDHDGYTVLRAYARAGETIDMGSSAMGLGGIADIKVYAPGTGFASATEPGMRALLPTDPVFGTDVFSCVADDPGTGRIAGRAEELAGPAPNVGGYTPCRYVAPADGIYAIVMVPYAAPAASSGVSTVSNPVTLTEQGPAISIWDVTVRDAAGAEQPGRVFTDAFEFLIPTAAATASNLSAFAYTPAGYLYHVTIFNPRAKAWDLGVNGSGVVDATTGEPISASFRWGPAAVGTYPPTLEPTYGQAVAPQMWEGDAPDDSRYPMFFRTPDPLVFSGPGGLGETRGYSATPLAPEGGLTSLLSFSGSGGEEGATVQGSGGTVAIDAPQLAGAGYDVTLDLDRDGTFGGGRDVELAGKISDAGATTAAWDGRDSAGSVVPCGVSYPYRVTSTLPALHVVQSDTGIEAGTQIERLSLPADPVLGGTLAASYNDVDPYKGTAVTNTAPSAVSEGTSGPTFHGWSAGTGHAVFTDTWASGHPVDGEGALEVSCPPPSGPSTTGGPGEAKETSGDGSTAGANTGAGAAAAPPSPPTGPKRHRHEPKEPKPPARSRPARLSLSVTAGDTRARPTSVIGYRLTITNTGGSAVRDVEVCDKVPAGQRLLRTLPATNGREPCWTFGSLAVGARRVFRLTAMVDAPVASGMQLNRATARAANVKGIRRDRVAIGVKPLPATACGSAVARPLPPGISLRC